MKYNDLQKIKKKYFSYKDISRVLSISETSAKVLASRYVKKKYLVRLRKNYYLFTEKWNTLKFREKIEIANIIQVPSYVSLMTALSYYEITTQVQQYFIESISLYRTFSKEIVDTTFNYSKIKRSYYFGFKRENNIFIALPEKSFIDAIYLTYQGKYHLDISSIDLEKIDQKKLNNLLQIYTDEFTAYIKRIFQ